MNLNVTLNFLISPDMEDRSNAQTAKKGPVSLVQTVQAIVEDAQRAKRYHTASNYRTAVRSLLVYIGADDLDMQTLNSEVIESYQRWLRNSNVKLNTISCYARALRAIYNKVKNRLDSEEDPFAHAFTGISRTVKRSIEADDLRRLRNLRLKHGSKLEQARDVFLFGFYALGMPFVDIAFLQKHQIKDGVLSYNRRKTHQPVRVKLEPCMEEILQRYSSPVRPYVFPYLTKTVPQQIYAQYQSALRQHNRLLKQLEEMAGLHCKLTSYVARHTWASIAFQQNLDLRLISKALGHTRTETTLIYIRELNDDYLATANHNLLQEVLLSD